MDGPPGWAAIVRRLLSPGTGLELPRADGGALRLVADEELPVEAYRLAVDADGITITAGDDAGVNWAVQTLRQLLPPAVLRPAPSGAPLVRRGRRGRGRPRLRLARRPPRRRPALHAAGRPLPDGRPARPAQAQRAAPAPHRGPGLALRVEALPAAAGGRPAGGARPAGPPTPRATAPRTAATTPRTSCAPWSPTPASAASPSSPSWSSPATSAACSPPTPSWATTPRPATRRRPRSASSTRCSTSTTPTMKRGLRPVRGAARRLPQPLRARRRRRVPRAPSGWPATPPAGSPPRAGCSGPDQLQRWFTAELGAWLAERGRILVGWDEIADDGPVADSVVMAWRDSSYGRAATAAGPADGDGADDPRSTSTSTPATPTTSSTRSAASPPSRTSTASTRWTASRRSPTRWCSAPSASCGPSTCRPPGASTTCSTRGPARTPRSPGPPRRAAPGTSSSPGWPRTWSGWTPSA